MAKPPKQRTARINQREIITIGAEVEFWSDLYHRAMTVRLSIFMAAVLALFVVNNMFFAVLYALDPAAISNVAEPRLLNLFFFSVESFTTAGFGDMHPQSVYGHAISTLEGFMALLQTAALTGLIFARFSRPRARIRFASNPVIAQYDGEPTLMIRLANARQNFISDATVVLWILRSEVSKEGQSYRRFHRLPLTRHENPSFILSWTLFHTISKDSLLYGLSTDDFEKQEIQFILTLKGTDDTSAQELRARKTYEHNEIIWGVHYADILVPHTGGGVVLDYRKFDETVEVATRRKAESH